MFFHGDLKPSFEVCATENFGDKICYGYYFFDPVFPLLRFALWPNCYETCNIDPVTIQNNNKRINT